MKAEKKKKKGFLDGYKTYDTKDGFGNRSEWRRTWERMDPEAIAAALDKSDPLIVMGFDSMPTKAELDARYRILVKQHHPDMGGDAKDFVRVHAAWSILTGGLS